MAIMNLRLLMAESTDDFLSTLKIKRHEVIHSRLGPGPLIAYEPMVKVILEANRLGLAGHTVTRVDGRQYMLPVAEGFLELGASQKSSLTNPSPGFQDRRGLKRRKQNGRARCNREGRSFHR